LDKSKQLSACFHFFSEITSQEFNNKTTKAYKT
jgi:hypothetical protein